jgi:tRNA threonylcarbamoyladenosine biosynthesis protein TsaE
VDIFKSSYANKKGQLTVDSHDGDKVIAPGTSNSFVFKLANTGNVPLDFTLDIDATTTDGRELPVKVRLHRYDNTWLLGDKDTWMFIPHLDQAGDKGTMGAGKTTFTRGLCLGLSMPDEVTSPTFALVNEYRGDKITLYHFDMYRINGEFDLETTGFYDYMSDDSIIAAEWSENIEDCLPEGTITISIETLSENTRKITVFGDERFESLGD